jgi:hypothetical protein
VQNDVGAVAAVFDARLAVAKGRSGTLARTFTMMRSRSAEQSVMSAAFKRRLYTILLVVSLGIGGAVFRLVLWLAGGGARPTLLSAGGQGMGIAAMSWALTTTVVFVVGLLIVRFVF